MKVPYHTISFGADPEFFFTKEGAIVGAEKVIPKGGVQGRDQYSGEYSGKPLVIIDGVQAEFNPQPNTCRQSFSINLQACFTRIAEEMKKKDGIKADFAQLVEVSKTEMKSLEESSQQFGCAPSNNAYKESAITVKASEYKYRSAGGHIHIGYYTSTTRQFFLEKPKHVIQIMDVIVGNTCVLLDRSEGNVERRKVYGRAGEYRTPPHGLEYRTLSNFWLQSYQLMSLVLGMVRFAVCVAMDEKASEKILSLVDMEKIQQAINTNDFNLALENFNAIKNVLSNIEVGNDATEQRHPLRGTRLKQFEFLVQKGINHFFKEDIMEHWLTHIWRNRHGWENFAQYVLIPAMTKEAKEKSLVGRLKSIVA